MISKPRKRSIDLIANFVDGFAHGWYMAVKESFKTELDIKLSDRKINKISCPEWTQGMNYCFSEGQVFYDTKYAYDCWEYALKHINIACQIVESKPNVPLKKTKLDTEANVIEGYVRIVLLEPNIDRTNLISFAGYHLTQNQFVNFLRTGTLPV